MTRFAHVLIVSCLLLQANSNPFEHILPPGQKIHLVSSVEDKVNLGRGLGGAWEAITPENFGLHFNLLWEFALGFDFPIWSDLQENKYLIKMNPQVILDWHVSSTLEIHLGVIDLIFTGEGNIWRFVPFDFEFWFDPTSPTRYCFGLGYAMQAIAFNLKFREKVQECYFGPFGFFQDNPLDCWWKNYKLDRPDQNKTQSYLDEMPVYTLKPWDVLDQRGEYVRFNCMNWFNADYPLWVPNMSSPDSLDYADKIRDYEVFANERPSKEKQIFDPNKNRRAKIEVPVVPQIKAIEKVDVTVDSKIEEITGANDFGGGTELPNEEDDEDDEVYPNDEPENNIEDEEIVESQGVVESVEEWSFE